MALTNHFMYSDMDYAVRCVPSHKLNFAMGDAIGVQPPPSEETPKAWKKFHAYAVYVGYRLDPHYGISHAARMSALSPSRPSAKHDLSTIDDEGPVTGSRISTGLQPTNLTGTGNYEIEDLDANDLVIEEPVMDDYDPPVPRPVDQEGEEEEDEKMLEELEDKQLLARISTMEGEHSKLKEQVWKLEHGRTWVENRLTAVEADMNALRSGESLPAVAAVVPPPAEDD